MESKPTMSSGYLRRMVGDLLGSVGIAESPVEADRIVGHVLGLSRASLHAHPERVVGEGDFSRIVEFSVRRATHEPLAYILGSALFCGLTLEVDRSTLIPRPETEVLCEAVQAHIGEHAASGGTFADWCTGSGALAISLLSQNPTWRAYAVDSSARALAVAERNAKRNGVRDRVQFIACSDPAEAADTIGHETLDLIVANPPYIPTAELAGLETQVGCFEPSEALDGGPDGLDVYRLLLETLPRYMKPNAPLFLETAGSEQASRISRLLSQGDKRSKLVHESNFCDHRGIERFMLWRKCD